MAEHVNHPSHYNDGKIEVIDYIEDKQLGFHLGNAVKYISRAGKKDPAKTIEALQKHLGTSTDLSKSCKKTKNKLYSLNNYSNFKTMKKILLMACLIAATSFIASAQSTSPAKPAAKTPVKTGRKNLTKKELTKIDLTQTEPDVYYMAVKKQDVEMLMGSARAGFTSWLHTTNTPMNAEPAANQQFVASYNGLAQQIADQRKAYADSLAALKAKTDTTKK